jgi:hypothetical protein
MTNQPLLDKAGFVTKQGLEVCTMPTSFNGSDSDVYINDGRNQAVAYLEGVQQVILGNSYMSEPQVFWEGARQYSIISRTGT